MNFYNKAKKRIHKKIINWRLRTNSIILSEEIQRKRNVFLYFDYEREFGGHVVNITDHSIAEILNFLYEHNISTTWFTVGKIFEKYPDSIKLLSEYGHELGSHTYNHTPTTKLNKKHLADDFSAFKSISKNYTVMGFHPPQGKWDLKTIKMLSDYGFKYEVAGYTSKNMGIPVEILNTKSITRFLTVGDDWLVYANQLNEEHTFNYFKNLFSKCETGLVTGIGFHPWILFHNKIYFNAFKRFIKYLMEFEDVQIKTAAEYLEIIKKNT